MYVVTTNRLQFLEYSKGMSYMSRRGGVVVSVLATGP
jgi:hypothetical protein